MANLICNAGPEGGARHSTDAAITAGYRRSLASVRPSVPVSTKDAEGAHTDEQSQHLSAVCRFNFSKWAVSLNSTPPGMEKLLPPSDMRWRKDVRFLEEGKYEEVRCCHNPCLPSG